MLARNPVWMALATAVALAGCVEPEDRSHQFTYLHATIIEPSCATANCHSAMTAQLGVDLSDVDVACADLAGKAMTTEDDPRNFLLLSLRGEAGVYEPMPLDGPLPPGDLELITQWIEAGAPCE